MQIQKINSQTSFGARSVIIQQDVNDLGQDILKRVSLALPSLLKMGDDNTDIIIKNGMNFYADDLLLEVEAKKSVDVMVKKIMKTQATKTVISASSLCEPKSAKDIMSIANSALLRMELKVKNIMK